MDSTCNEEIKRKASFYQALVSNPQSTAVWVVACLLGVLHLWRIQDIPWINDEPQLIIKALVANEEGVLAKSGLMGSFGVTYSPVIVWFYQFLLLFTYSIKSIAATKTAIMLLGTFSGAFYLTRQTRFSPVGVLLIATSPYLWFYDRIVWDNVFLIPASLWLIAMMASFLRTPRGWKVYVSGGICVFLLHVHLMACLPIASVLITAAIARRNHLKREWRWYVFTVIGCVLAFMPYLLSFSRQEVRKSSLHNTDIVDSLTASLTGWRFFSHWKFDHLVSAERYNSAFMSAGVMITFVSAAILFITGFVFASTRWRLVIKGRSEPTLPDWLNLYAMIAIIATGAFFIGTRAAPLPHYYNATWTAYLLLCWYGYTGLIKRFRWSWIPFVAYVTLTVSMTCAIMVSIANTHGDKSTTYGPTIGNQLDVARALAPHWPNLKLDYHYSPYRFFPHALNSLLALEMKRLGFAPNNGPRRSFIIRFTTPTHMLDGKMKVEGTSLNATP